MTGVQRVESIAVAMPAYNEAGNIEAMVTDVIQVMDTLVDDYEVIVVDDGSTDRTGRIARERGAIVVRHETPEGLGKSFSDGLARALQEGADIIVHTDADGQFNCRDIPELIAPILEDRADFVTASRFARRRRDDLGRPERDHESQQGREHDQGAGRRGRQGDAQAGPSPPEVVASVVLPSALRGRAGDP